MMRYLYTHYGDPQEGIDFIFVSVIYDCTYCYQLFSLRILSHPYISDEQEYS